MMAEWMKRLELNAWIRWMDAPNTRCVYVFHVEGYTFLESATQYMTKQAAKVGAERTADRLGVSLLWEATSTVP